MRLEIITINNFKNIGEASLEFSPSLNCLLGDNGMGKSNLLDAIYFLSYCRSFSGMTDTAVMKRDADFFSLQGVYQRKNVTETLHIGMNKGKRKVLKRKGKEYTKLSEHIGAFPLVLVAPRDSFLIIGSSEERRKFMDMIISQGNPIYLNALMRYHKALDQRNKLLRAGVIDTTLYEAIEMSMCQAAETIHTIRKEWLPEFEEKFRKYYNQIAGGSETVSLRIKSHLAQEGAVMQDLLAEARRHDEIVGYTTVGPHRDDIEIFVNGLEARHTASQGQSKTITISMRFAQFEFLRQSTGLTPILMLDDIFDKLDSSRVARIINIVSSEQFGQIFITDTNREHLDVILRDSTAGRAMWLVEDGKFKSLIKE